MTDPIQPQISVQQLILGDEPEWEKFVVQFTPLLRAVIARTLQSSYLGRNDDNIDEILQDVFASLLKNDRRILRAYDSQKGTLRTWLALKARSVALDGAKKKQIATVPLDEARAVAAAPNLPCRVLDIPEGVLTEAEQRILHRLYVEDMTPEEIAVAEEISVKTIYSRKSKALLKLRRALLD